MVVGIMWLWYDLSGPWGTPFCPEYFCYWALTQEGNLVAATEVE